MVEGEKVAPEVVHDMRLRNMHVRASWGLQVSSELGNILVKDENVFYAIMGKRICEIRGSKPVGGKYMFPHVSNVQSVICLGMSQDKSLLGASVHEVGDTQCAGVLVYATDHKVGTHKRPKYMQFQPDRFNGVRYALGIAFSHDSAMMACHTNHMNDGVFVYDYMLEQLVAQVPIKNPISFVTFNPRDVARIAVTGDDELCEFWHYSSRNAHIAPISHLPDLDSAAYTHHVWLENTVVLAGTDDGRVVLIQVCT